MNLKNVDFKKLGTYLLPVLILFVLSCAFFYPTLKGYSLRQGDMRNYAGAAQSSEYYHEVNGDYTWWNDAMFAGMPNTQIFGDYNGNWIKHLGRTLVYNGYRPISILFIYGLAFYIMLLSLGMRRWLSLIGAIAYAYSSYFIIILEAGHVTKAMAIGFMPLVLAGVFLIFKGKHWLGLALASLGFALELYSNHVQITYYLLLFILVFGVAKFIEAIKKKDLKSFLRPVAFSAFALLVGVLCNFAGLFNTYEYGKHTTRGESNVTISPDGTSKTDDQTNGLDRSYVTNWSYGRQENLTFFIPNAVGGASGQIGNIDAVKKVDPRFAQNIAQSNHYWGNQSFTSGPVYIGAGIFLLAILALVFVNGYFKWVLLAVSLLAILLGMGKNLMWFTDFFLDFVPGYSKFRTVTMILVLLELCLPILAIMFLKKVIDNREDILAQKKKMLISAGCILGVTLLLIAAPGSVLDFISDGEKANFSNQIANSPESASAIQMFIDGLKDVRISIFRSDAIRSLLIMAAIFGAVYVYVVKRFKTNYLFIIIGLVVLGDLWSVNRRYISSEKINGQYANYELVESNEYPYAPSPNDVKIYQSELSNRPDLNQTIEAKVKNEVSAQVSKLNARNRELLAWNIRFGELNLNTNFRVFNLNVSPFNDASTSYFHKSIGGYHGAKLKRYQELIEFHIGGSINPQVLNMLNTKYIITQNGLQVNDRACGNAWFVDSVKRVKSDNEEIKALDASVFDAANMALVSESIALNNPVVENNGTIEMVSYLPNKIVYNSRNDVAGLAVFSEVYYPMFWKAFIDGVEVEHIRVDFLLRGLEVPAGEHEIVFEYNVTRIQMTDYVATAGSLLLIFLLGLGTYKTLKTKNEELV